MKIQKYQDRCLRMLFGSLIQCFRLWKIDGLLNESNLVATHHVEAAFCSIELIKKLSAMPGKETSCGELKNWAVIKVNDYEPVQGNSELP